MEAVDTRRVELDGRLQDDGGFRKLATFWTSGESRELGMPLFEVLNNHGSIFGCYIFGAKVEKLLMISLATCFKPLRKSKILNGAPKKQYLPTTET